MFAKGQRDTQQYVVSQVEVIRVQVRDDVAARSVDASIHCLTDAALNVFNQCVRTLQCSYPLQRAVSGAAIDEDVVDLDATLHQYGGDRFFQPGLAVAGAGNDGKRGQFHRRPFRQQ
jgi:hypothetical protein